MKQFARALAQLPWWFLLILVIFFDGLVGGIIRVGKGKLITSKIVGWMLIILFIVTILTFIPNFMPAVVSRVLQIVYLVCWICDVITVIVYKKILVLAQ